MNVLFIASVGIVVRDPEPRYFAGPHVRKGRLSRPGGPLGSR
jgi:hypothetical protein